MFTCRPSHSCELRFQQSSTERRIGPIRLRPLREISVPHTTLIDGPIGGPEIYPRFCPSSARLGVISTPKEPSQDHAYNTDSDDPCNKGRPPTADRSHRAKGHYREDDSPSAIRVLNGISPDINSEQKQYPCHPHDSNCSRITLYQHETCRNIFVRS